jgi:hypothetical protein
LKKKNERVVVVSVQRGAKREELEWRSCSESLTDFFGRLQQFLPITADWDVAGGISHDDRGRIRFLRASDHKEITLEEAVGESAAARIRESAALKSALAEFPEISSLLEAIWAAEPDRVRGHVQAQNRRKASDARAKWGTEEKRLSAVQNYLNTMFRSLNVTALISAAANDCKVSKSYIHRHRRKGDLTIPPRL